MVDWVLTWSCFMPSSRIPKTSSKTMSGAKRPLVSDKNDLRLKGARQETTQNFYVGDGTTASVTSIKGDKSLRLSRKYSTKGNPKSSYASDYNSADAKKDQKSSNAGVKAMGSYARNYFKNNSK